MNRRTVTIVGLCALGAACLTVVLVAAFQGGRGGAAGIRARFDPAQATLRGPVNNQWTLEHDLVFIDGAGVRWTAPKGTRSDGASIPRFALSLINSNFDETVIMAAILHDAYCGELNKGGGSYQRAAWDDVHSMFYNALRASGCDQMKAKTMYVAVKMYVPRWAYPPDAGGGAAATAPTGSPTDARAPAGQPAHPADGPDNAWDPTSYEPAAGSPRAGGGAAPGAGGAGRPRPQSPPLRPPPLPSTSRFPHPGSTGAAAEPIDDALRRQRLLEIQKWVRETNPSIKEIDARLAREAPPPPLSLPVPR